MQNIIVLMLFHVKLNQLKLKRKMKINLNIL